jgi:hypothetical protein
MLHPLFLAAALALVAIFVIWGPQRRPVPLPHRSGASYANSRVPRFPTQAEDPGEYTPPGGSPYNYSAPATRNDPANMNAANVSAVGRSNAPEIHPEAANPTSLIPPGTTHYAAPNSRHMEDRFQGQSVASGGFAKAAQVGMAGKNAAGNMFNPVGNSSVVFNTSPIPLDMAHAGFQ